MVCQQWRYVMELACYIVSLDWESVDEFGLPKKAVIDVTKSVAAFLIGDCIPKLSPSPSSQSSVPYLSRSIVALMLES